MTRTRFLLFFLLISRNAYTHQLDNEYTKNFTDILEYLYGNSFLSQGGNESVALMFAQEDLNHKKMLDIGSGLGGAEFDLAQNYEVDVTGIDCVQRLIEDANERKNNYALKGAITFMHQPLDHLTYPYNDNEFDIIFSKECLVHVSDKRPVLKESFRMLKPGGSLIILDWTTESKQWGKYIPEMIALDELSLHMTTIQEYKNLLHECGFENIFLKNMNEHSIKYTQENIEKIISRKDQLIELFGEHAYEYCLQSWNLQQKVFLNNDATVLLLKATTLN